MTAVNLKHAVSVRKDDGKFVTLAEGHPINYSSESAHGKKVHKFSALVAGEILHHTTVTELKERPSWL